MGRNMVGRGGGPNSVRRHGVRCSVDQSSVILWNLDPILKTIKPVLFLSFSNMPGNMIWLKETWFNIITIARLTSEHYSLAVVLQVRSLDRQHQHHPAACLKLNSQAPPRLNESETLGWSARIRVLRSPLGDSNAWWGGEPLSKAASPWTLNSIQLGMTLIPSHLWEH